MVSFGDVPITPPANATVQEVAIWNSVERVRTENIGLMKLSEELHGAEGEVQESILLQRLDHYGMLLAELKELTGLLDAYKKSGADPQVLLADYSSGLLRTGSHLREDIDSYRKQFQEHNKERDTQTPEGVKAYIMDSRQIDMAYSLLDQYIEVVKSLGYDAEPSRRYLSERLPRRADVLAGRIRLTIEREKEVKNLKVGDEGVQAKTALIAKKLKADTDSLQQTIAMAGKLDLDMSGYQTLLVKATGQISSELLDTDVLGELFHDWWLDTKHSIKSNLSNVLLKMFVFVLILLVFRGLATIAKRVMRRSVQSASVRLSLLMQNMVISMTSRLIMLLGLLVALAQMGVSLGPVLAGLGVAGFVIGFALQDTLGNFAAGVMILIYRPYDVGDMVEAAGAFGTVKSMNIVSTTILTIDNQTLIIPNNKIWGDVIKNVTAQKIRRVDMVFGISYSDSIEHAETILCDILEKHEKVLPQPESMVKLHTLGESSMDFVVRPWVRTEDYWNVYWDVTRAVKMRFDAEGVSIPFPQRDIHFYPTGKGMPAPTAGGILAVNPTNPVAK